MSLLAWFSSFAMSHSKIPSFYVQTHMRAPTHRSARIHILSQRHARTRTLTQTAQSLKMKPQAFFFENSQD